jgi:hypothetical protein
MSSMDFALVRKLFAVSVSLATAITVTSAWAYAAEPAKPAALNTTIVYLGKQYNEPPPLSLVDKPVTDNGIQGARIALEEDNRTGRLINQHYDLLEAIVPVKADDVAKANELVAAGHCLIV